MLDRPRSTAETRSENRSEARAPSLSPFERLPRSVIEHILYLVDANAFASLALLNRKWRRISDSSWLYAHHLSDCQSFNFTQNVSPIGVPDLHYLKHRFFSEIRRNVFDVFLRPRRTLIKLISTSVSSSTAFPQGDAFRFFFSPNGHMVLCINSARIIVLDVTSDPVIRHEFKISRRPLSATILDSGRVLAVVSSSHQINIYSLSDEEAKHVQALALNDVPRALALSPTGSVLAVAYKNSIQIYALCEMVPSSERRAVQCAGVDSLVFNSDETMILGSSVECGRNDTITITAPLSSDDAGDGLSPEEIQTRLWATQVLFPSTIPGYSHASLLPLHAEGDASWVLGYDSRVAAFRATKVNNANAGATYFSNPASSSRPQKPLPFVPTVDDKGELVALGFQEFDVWLYGIPDRLDTTPRLLGSHVNGESQSAGLLPALRNSTIERQQSISQPKGFLRGHKMIEMPGITAACWVRQTLSEGRRLVAVAPGGIRVPTIGEELPVDSGRVLVLDFERSPKNGETSEIEIEIGDAEPKTLKEPNSSMDTEVQLERRRTRLRRDNPLATSSSMAPRPSPVDDSLSNANDDMERGRGTPIPDIPYDNMQPRSHDTLQRAATAAATHGRYQLRQSYEADAARRVQQIPHESDADNWVPPPPPYALQPNAPLPEDLRRTLLPTRTAPAWRNRITPPRVQWARTMRIEGMGQGRPSRHLSMLEKLNPITGSRLPSSARHNRRESEPSPQDRWERGGLHRRRGSPGQPVVPYRASEHGQTPTPLAPAQQRMLDTPPSNRVPQTGVNYDTPGPESPPQQDTYERAAEDPEWQVFAQTIQNATSGLSFHSFSISTPELHEPSEGVANTARGENEVRGAQYQDPLLPTRGVGSPNRVATDPTHSQSSTNSWRRRIEEWNEDTVYQRSKKSRNRCAVM